MIKTKFARKNYVLYFLVKLSVFKLQLLERKIAKAGHTLTEVETMVTMKVKLSYAIAQIFFITIKDRTLRQL